MLSETAQFWIQWSKDQVEAARARRCEHGPNCQEHRKTETDEGTEE